MPESPYDAIAEWYDASIRGGSLIHDLVLPALLALAGDVSGQHICDLACGQGVVARQLARQGAAVLGVDLSPKLLAIAQRYEDAVPLGITYRRDDAQQLTSVGNAACDGVVCNMALMDISDIEAVFQAVHRILRPCGWFILSMTHPCFLTPASGWHDAADGTISRVVRGYFTEGLWRSDNPSGVRGQVGAYHRTVSTYINALHDSGLTLDQMKEPRALGTMAERLPGYMEVPAILLIRCKKA